jgi:hypothetical protein
MGSNPAEVTNNCIVFYRVTQTTSCIREVELVQSSPAVLPGWETRWVPESWHRNPWPHDLKSCAQPIFVTVNSEKVSNDLLREEFAWKKLKRDTTSHANDNLWFEMQHNLPKNDDQKVWCTAHCTTICYKKKSPKIEKCEVTARWQLLVRVTPTRTS